MQRAACLFLCFVFLAGLLTGCKKPPAASPADAGPASEASQTSASDTPGSAPRLGEAVPVEGFSLAENEFIRAVACRENEALIVTGGWSEEGPDPDPRFIFVDTEACRVTSTAVFRQGSMQNGFSGAVLEEDRVLLYDRFNDTAWVYGRDGSDQGAVDYPVDYGDNLPQRTETADEAPLIDGSFISQPGCALFSSAQNGFSRQVAAAFADDPAHIFLVEDLDGFYTAHAGHRILLNSHEADDTVRFRLVDADRSRMQELVYAYPRQEQQVYLNCGPAAIGEDWVLLSVDVSWEDHQEELALVWFPDPAGEQEIRVEHPDRTALREKTEALAQTLEAQYGVTFLLDAAPAPAVTPIMGLDVNYGENKCVVGAPIFGQYRIVRDLEGFFGMLPPGMVRELYTNLGYDLPDRETLEIYLVREIPGSASAFAGAWADPMMVCFATDEYFESNLPHEFMHLIDLRINEYMFAHDRNWEPEWWALSPEDAYGTGGETDWSYFVSSYAATNAGEDRAETFARLWNSDEPLSEQYWYAEAPGVQTKVQTLIRTIREVFPSVQAVEKAFWEKDPGEAS